MRTAEMIKRAETVIDAMVQQRGYKTDGRTELAKVYVASLITVAVSRGDYRNAMSKGNTLAESVMHAELLTAELLSVAMDATFENGVPRKI